jgi:NAD(P)-dependent dehydrogenase (short-subunit alcohol dehydrogenase family)
MRILLTGGTSGLGLAMVRALVADGHQVVLTGRDADRAAEVAAAHGAVGIGMDVRDEAAVRAGRDRVLERLGGLDVLINNAGIGMRTVNPRFLTDPQPFWQVGPDGFRDVVATNLTGYFLVASAFVPDLLDSADAQVINISMNHATMRRRGFVPYGPSRAGAEALSLIMGEDLAEHGVRVNLLLPGGATRTGMVPDGVDPAALLEPDVMAAPVRWLCSPAAAGVHGQRIVATEFSDWLAAR